MPFAVALSGLNAASSDLNVTGNNIANANTTGFKASRAEFSDVFAVGAQAIGNGVRLSAVSQEFSQGGVDFTDRGLDLAISGEGFFTMSDGGVINYSRVGSFGVDRDGFVVNNQNQKLQIFPVANNGTFNTGTLSDLRLATTDAPPQASAVTEFGVNLPANAAPPPVAIFDPNNASTLQPLDRRHDLRLARRVAHGHGLFREDGNRQPMGGAVLHRRHSRRRRERDDVLEPRRAHGAGDRQLHAARLCTGNGRRTDHAYDEFFELDAIRLRVRRELTEPGRLRLGPPVEHRRRHERRGVRAIH